MSAFSPGGSAWGAGGLMPLTAESRSRVQGMKINNHQWSDTRLDQMVKDAQYTYLRGLAEQLKRRYQNIGAFDVAAAVRVEGSAIVVDSSMSSEVFRLEYGDLHGGPKRIVDDPTRPDPLFEDIYSRVFNAARGIV